jgi:hypothetical protein
MKTERGNQADSDNTGHEGLENIHLYHRYPSFLLLLSWCRIDACQHVKC